MPMNDPKPKLRQDLEQRLITFSVSIIKFIDGMPATPAGRHLSGQLLRSSISPALNYGEAQAGESRNDFIHKMRIVLKELRESLNCLRIIQQAGVHPHPSSVVQAEQECNELVAIFVTSLKTADMNRNN